jgi:hypothetical protein
MKKEKKDPIIRKISEQSMLKLTPMPFRAQDSICEFLPQIIFEADTVRAFSAFSEGRKL